MSAPALRSGSRPNLRSWLEQPEVRREIAPTLDATAYASVIREVLQCVSENPEIKRCDLWSIKYAITRCVSWDVIIGEKCFLIPRPDEERNGAWRLHPFLGYKGASELLMRHGVARQVDARPVYKNEFFKPHYGTQPRIDHDPIMAPEDRGALVGAYAWAKLSPTDVKIDVISAEEIDAIRWEYSRDWAEGSLDGLPWYAAKTALHRLANQLPMSPRVKALFEDRDVRAPRIEPGSPTEKQLLAAGGR